ncbi:uncharacterized protein LOC123369101 [Mauremys mutica]|uniref:uncharacterized protein LOC123369101 n=1 Tax=Mauremys mutica TaxID=74926 RepID=UPI001D16EF33|nr:uncharacterized protein LOC123369101 [Mauremys mutica]
MWDVPNPLGVWTQFDDICQFPEKSWFGFLSRGKSKETASESILQFLEDELYQELSHRKDFGDVERKLHCYKEHFKTSNIGDAEQKINDQETDFDERKESDVNVVLKEIARRTEAWLGTRRQTGNAEDVLQPKELEDILQCLNLTLALVTIFLKHSEKIPFSPVMMSLQILELFSGTEDLLQTKRDFRDLKQTRGLKEFMNVAESWIQELFPKSPEQEKVFFHYIDVSPKKSQ